MIGRTKRGRGVLTTLWWPVLVPSFAYSIGAAAIVPAQILTGLQLGLSASAISLLVTWLGACAVLGSMVAGATIHALGELRALAVATVVGSGCLTVLVVWLNTGGPGPVWVFAVAVSLVEIADGIWSLARQSLVADLVDVSARARGMNAYAGAQRIGRVLGPLLTAAAVAGWNVSAAYLGHIVLACLAYALVHRSVRGSRGSTTDTESTTGTTTTQTSAATRPRPGTAVRRAPSLRRAFVLIGLGVVVLAFLRTDRDLLLPLWGADGLGLSGEVVSLVIAVAAGLELLLFWPAGVVMDRVGRMPVAVACLVGMSVGFGVLAAYPSSVGYVAGAVLLGLSNGFGAGLVKILGVDLAPPGSRARFLGRWNALANGGALVAPAVTTAVLTVGTTRTVLAVACGFGVLAAGWLAWWMPRLMPQVAVFGRSGQPSPR